MVFRKWLLAVAGIVLAVPVAAQDVSAALWEMCEGTEAYDTADIDAVRANADDFCAVFLSEPRKARSQLNKMIVRNRAALNPNRWYIDVRRVPPAHRSRYDGAYVQLRRSWMGANWAIHWEPCDPETWEGHYDSARDGDYQCFTFANNDDAASTFHVLIAWSRPDPEGDGGDPHLSVRTVDGAGNESNTVVDFGNTEHGLDQVGEGLDTRDPDGGNGNGDYEPGEHRYWAMSKSIWGAGTGRLGQTAYLVIWGTDTERGAVDGARNYCNTHRPPEALSCNGFAVWGFDCSAYAQDPVGKVRS